MSHRVFGAPTSRASFTVPRGYDSLLKQYCGKSCTEPLNPADARVTGTRRPPKEASEHLRGTAAAFAEALRNSGSHDIG